ncbi:MAG: ASKHA domain-containing protein [Chloroflexota bacterium]
MTTDIEHKARHQFSLNVLPHDLWLTAKEGETIWEVLRGAGVNIGECGGLGKCGKCKVKVISAIGPITNEEKHFLSKDEIEEGIRLACRTTVDRDLVVYLSEPESEEEFSQILITGSRPVFNLDPLLDQKIITLSSKAKEEDSSFDSVKNTLGPAYSDLRASLHCLRALPHMLRRTQFRGAAVLHDNQLITWQGLEQIHSLYGLSFDIGTTTLVGKLINLVDGTEVAVVSRLNGQSKYGTDVISRLQYVMDYENGLENLSQILIDNLNHITRRLLKTVNADADDVFVAVAAGNTTMQHLLLKMDPSGLAEAPFAPVATEGLIVRAPDVGLQLNPEAVVYVMPVKSGYIGGDLVSVIIASGAAEQDDEIILGMDFGTNGEIFLGNRKRMMTCSAAAGPALEGGRISYGMIAAAGAIEAVSFEGGELHYQVVGNIRPKGICGSGLVELVAVLLELGIIDSEGLIRTPEVEVAEKLKSRVVSNGEGANDFIVAFAEESFDGWPIYLKQKDIRELQLAKGAIAAGTKILMDQMGISPQDIGKVYLAGALGNYVNPHSAMRIGLVPVVDAANLSSLGNAASTGPSMVLLSKHYWQLANKLIHFIEHIELSSRIDFNEQFVEQIDFPEGKIMDVYLGEIERELMAKIMVSEVMTSEFPVVSPSMTLEEFRGQLKTTNHHGFPVVDGGGRLCGCVTLADLESSVYAGNTDLTVADIATQNPLVAYPNQSLHEVLRASEKDYGRIPVVDPHDHTRLLGVLRRHDILQAYRAKAAKASKASVGT